MFDAVEIARHLVRVGYDPESPNESVLVCPLRLQKLLYYCQGWSLALLGRPLFRQELEAWKDGPVVRDVYRKFSGTWDGITPDRAGEPQSNLPESEARLVEMVWKTYACFPPKQLSAKTHTERPWLEARGDLPPDALSSAPLSQDTMRDFFSEVAQKSAIRNRKPGLPVIFPGEGWRAFEEADRQGHESTLASDVFTDLLAESAS
jgi:uncharacterized phage-associated protein